MTDQDKLIEQGIRLQNLIKALKTNGKRFAESVSARQSHISQISNGKRAITVNVLGKITARYPKANPVWLLYGTGEMFLQDNKEPKGPDIPVTDLSILSHNIIAIRRRWNRDQGEFGKLLGQYTRNQVSNWERGRTAVEYEALCRLEALSGIPQKKIRNQELTRSEIPELPNPWEIPLPEPLPTISDVLDMQREILTRISRIEEILQGIQTADTVAGK